MALDYDELMSKVQTDLPFSYTDADTMLYALSVGMGNDPLDLRRGRRWSGHLAGSLSPLLPPSF